MSTDDTDSLVDHDQIRDYVSLVFGGAAEDGSLCVNARLIGEKGTEAEGRKIENHFLAYKGVDDTAEWLAGFADKCADQDTGVFVVPGFLTLGALESRRANAGYIHSFKSICIDVDSGDTDEIMAAAEAELGPVSAEVWSGGITDDGQAKLHLYWELDGLTERWADVGVVRENLALKFGGDPAFKRPTQVIRVPGTVHAKAGKRSQCRFERRQASVEAPIDELVRRYGQPAKKAPVGQPDTSGGGISARAGAGKEYGSASEATISDIHEGSTSETNRWSAFSEVAGHYVHEARAGTVSLEKARALTHGWMMAHMKPSWPEERFEKEWTAIVRVDVSNKGAIPVNISSPVEVELADDALTRWSIGSYTEVKPPPRRWLVDGLVLAGKRQMVAASGGVGKSYAMMHLGLLIAAAPHVEHDLTWMGHKVDAKEAGVVVMLSCEDDKDEVTRRLHEVDPTGNLREHAADDFIVIPTDNIGGSFPLVTYDRKGVAVWSKPWAQFMAALEKIKEDGRTVSLVILDTLNAVLHGEENSAQVASEFVSAVAPICGDIGAALMVTHHTRKGGEGEAMTADQIRGSNAIINSMRNVIGFYPSPDHAEILPLLGKPGYNDELFEMAIVKGNVRELMRGKRYLVRGDEGFLVDVTHEVETAIAQRDARASSDRDEREAWLLFAIKWAAEQGHPYSISGDNGLFARSGSLVRMVVGDKPSATALQSYARELKEQGKIIEVPQIYDEATNKALPKRLDVPGGALLTDKKDGIDSSKPFAACDYSLYAYDITSNEIVPAKRVDVGDKLRQNVSNITGDNQ